MKKQLLTLVMLLLPMVACADAVEINGICYNLITKGKIAEVTKNFNSTYTGDIIIPEKVNYNGVDYDVTSIGGPVNYNGSTYMGGAFRGCTGLETIIIPKSVTSIGEGAFYGCTGLISITIPNGVTSIGNEAFSGCSGLTTFTIPSSATSIGKNAFSGCSGLTSITIPSSWSSIGDGVFGGCTNLTSITIPNNISSIGEAAFIECTGLTSITIPNSVNYIGNQAFGGCTSLSSVTIPNNVSYLGKGAFGHCSSLTSITIPESLTSISSGTFAYCTSLTSVTIPNSVTSIGGDNVYGGAFSGCSGLTTFTIPNSVSIIGNQAFLSCSHLSSIKLGSGMKSIGSYAFMDCPELTDMYCYSENVPSTNSDVFRNSYIEYATLHVPTTSIDAYNAVEPWKRFKAIVGLDGTLPDEPEVEKCATPTISYAGGKLIFDCATEGAEYVYEITDTDIKKGYTSEVDLTVTYNITVYATKTGYDNSDVATATLCWIDVTPEGDNVVVGQAEVRANPVLIKSNGGVLNIEGVEEGTDISVYDTAGRMVGMATVANGTTNISTTLRSGEIGFVKIGKKAVKVAIK